MIVLVLFALLGSVHGWGEGKETELLPFKVFDRLLVVGHKAIAQLAFVRLSGASKVCHEGV